MTLYIAAEFGYYDPFTKVGSGMQWEAAAQEVRRRQRLEQLQQESQTLQSLRHVSHHRGNGGGGGPFAPLPPLALSLPPPLQDLRWPLGSHGGLTSWLGAEEQGAPCRAPLQLQQALSLPSPLPSPRVRPA